MGGDYIFLLLANFLVFSSKTSVGAIFRLNGEEISSPEVSIAYSTLKETSVTIITPYVDLGSQNASTVAVLIYSKTDPQQSVTLNYTYINVLPFIESFLPTAVSDAGGETVLVKIRYFPYPSQNMTVRFGNDFIEAKIFASSNQLSTLISFVSPPGISVGTTQVMISESQQICTKWCKGRASFLINIKDSKALELAPPLPTSATYQELSELGMFLPIQIRNVDVDSIHVKGVVGFITSRRVGSIYTPSLRPETT